MRRFCALAALLVLSPTAFCDDSWARVASSTGVVAYLGLGLGLTYLRDGDMKVDHTLRVADSAGTALILSELMKDVIHSPGPGGDGNSFPSSHASTVFALGSMLAHYHPQEAAFWYAGAAAISYSRIPLQAHRPSDVLAGAALGFGITQLELHCKRGLLISPFVMPTSRGLIVSVKGDW
jgi:membrane-associated phospholipid phosphatase